MDIAIIGPIIGLTGLTITISKLYHDYSKQRNISWKAVLKYVAAIADNLRSHDNIPHIIISFPKGGLIVADLLGHCFNNEIDIVSIHTARVIENNVVTVRVRFHYVNFSELKDKRILIIDDILENGLTINRIIQLLVDNGISRNNISTAVLGKTPLSASVLQPDYYCFEYIRSSKRKLHFPWSEVTL